MHDYVTVTFSRNFKILGKSCIEVIKTCIRVISTDRKYILHVYPVQIRLSVRVIKVFQRVIICNLTLIVSRVLLSSTVKYLKKESSLDNFATYFISHL